MTSVNQQPQPDPSQVPYKSAGEANGSTAKTTDSSSAASVVSGVSGAVSAPTKVHAGDGGKSPSGMTPEELAVQEEIEEEQIASSQSGGAKGAVSVSSSGSTIQPAAQDDAADYGGGTKFRPVPPTLSD